MDSHSQTYRNLPPVWIKAAVLGSVWGAIEIIVGSFLHNLRLPFSGTILSTIGVSLLVGGHFLFKDKGLIWRAGVVCALMKSISPSAVIIGPMVGILGEAFVLELFVRTARGTVIGLIAGSAVAVCLPFLQTLISLLITYGLNISALYAEMFKTIAKNFGIRTIDATGALGIVFVLHAMFGIGAAILGMIVARKAISTDTLPQFSSTPDNPFSLQPVNANQRFSIPMLAAHVIVIPVVLLVIGRATMIWSAIIVTGYAALMIWLYPASWKRFSKPRIWIGLLVITISAGFLLGEVTNQRSGWAWTLDGIFIGLQMSIRAVFMVVAFNVVSIELRNPKIVGWVLRRGLGQIAGATEIAFKTLPVFVAAIGEQRNVLRHPIISLSKLFAVAKHRLDELGKSTIDQKRIYILTGDRASGKTSLLTRIVTELQEKNLCVGGILSPVIRSGVERIGYDVINIQTRQRIVLCRKNAGTEEIRVSDWSFPDASIQFGISAINSCTAVPCAVVIVDEVGPLELRGHGWSPGLDTLLTSQASPVILIVREQLIAQVQERWSFLAEKIWKIDNRNWETVREEIFGKIQIHNAT